MMDENSNSNQNGEAEGNNEIMNLENDNPENSTEHINRPVINIEKNEINVNDKNEDNLKLIQDRINQEINLQELEDIEHKKNSKENSSLKEIKKPYKNLLISNNNFSIAKNPKNTRNAKHIKINNYIYKTNNNNINININNANNKFMKYDDELKRYYFNKEFSNLHINTDENFLERMKFDIYKRQIKEKKIDDFIQNNKVKIKEEKKIKTFNHLIEDANRRLKAQINAEHLNTELNQDLLGKDEPKKYNDDEWDIIYQKRFKNYLDRVNKKKKENKKIIEEEKMKKEEEILKLIPNKKVSQKHIEETAEKMYEEAIKRNIKKKEIIEKFDNIKISNLPIKNNINIKTEEKPLKENNSKNNILNNFLITNTNNKNKFNKRQKSNKSLSKNTTKSNKKTKNININNSYNKRINKSQNKENKFDLEKERQLLIQMVETKKLPGDINNNKLNDIQEIYINQKNIKEEENNKIKESDKIINDFFMRQLIQ